MVLFLLGVVCVFVAVGVVLGAARCFPVFLIGGPVYSKAGPVYYRVGPAGLPCVFPGTLFFLSSGRSCVPRRSLFGSYAVRIQLVAWDPANSRSGGPGLY